MIMRFEIRKLYGYRDYDIAVDDNRLILVGENGAGKTTILRLLFLALTGQWTAIARYDFESITLSHDRGKIIYNKQRLHERLEKAVRRSLRHLPEPIRDRVLMQTNVPIDIEEIDQLASQYGISSEVMLQEIQSATQGAENVPEELVSDLKILSEANPSQVIYLPTYRRIEQELQNIVRPGRDIRERGHLAQRRFFRNKNRPSFLEKVEFGMRDVVAAIQDMERQLKEFAYDRLNQLSLGHLRDVVERQYEKIEISEVRNATDAVINGALARIHGNILSDEDKSQLRDTIYRIKSGADFDENAKVVCHYFLKLISLQQQIITQESGIIDFCNKCNQYLVDKEFQYEGPTFKFNILPKSKRNKREIELKHLSSGEKQIVSLFSHLYLSGPGTFYVLIDEPELSLSVTWQRTFLLDISNGQRCAGLIAVTHSPFIYDNDLSKYAHSIDEFARESE